MVSRVKELCSFPDALEAVRVISGLRWVGLFSHERVVPRGGNLLDTLCARLEALMAYAPGERDLVMLQHKFVVEQSDGTEVRILQVKNGFARAGPDLSKSDRNANSKSSRRHSRRMGRQTGILRWPSLSAYLAGLLHRWSLMARFPPQACWCLIPKKYATPFASN